MHVITTPEDVAHLTVSDPGNVAYLTQTTLAVDETRAVVDALRERFPAIVGPGSDDICYATQNRQDGVRALAREVDAILVVGSRNSSNSMRLVEVAQRAGCPATLIDGAADVPPELLVGAGRVGVTAGASAPESLVQEIVSALGGLGGTTVTELEITREDVHFKLPPTAGRRR
jgi:4-hydroxy-3-methylbut-2-enyl diphosphate reductase